MMTSFGRGRGILPSKKPPTSLPNNGCSSIVGQNSVRKLASSRSAVAAYENAKSSPDLHSFGEKLISLGDEECLFPLVFDIINSETCTVEMVERMVKIIIDRCMWLPSVSKKYANLLNILSLHNSFGKDIRRFTFNSLQTFYEEREDLLKSKKYGESTFRNVVILTGEIYYRYRLGDSRYKFLAEPMLTYLHMLIRSKDESDIFTLTQQISWSGQDIAKINEDGMNELLFDIRRCIVNSGDYTEKTKWVLLLCYELQFQPFESLSDNVKKFYQKNLGGNILASICPPPLELENPIKPEYYHTINHFFA